MMYSRTSRNRFISCISVTCSVIESATTADDPPNDGIPAAAPETPPQLRISFTSRTSSAMRTIQAKTLSSITTIHESPESMLNR